MDVTRAAPEGPEGTDIEVWGEPTDTTELPDDPGAQHNPQDDQGPLDLGRVVGNRYLLIGRLGRGGMGVVWKARDTRIARDVAVKQPLLPEAMPEEERKVAFARLEQEARAAAQIDHPAVVTIHDVLTENGEPLIVMELIEGHSLADTLRQGMLSPAHAARIALPIVGALAQAHAHAVFHRDVKPSNIMLGRGDRVVLTDFGIAQVEGATPLTRTGAFVGSDDYTAPERIRGLVAGPESDLFSVGVVLFTAIEGYSPFGRNSRQATHEAVVNTEPPEPRRAGELSDLILRLLAKDPSDRPRIPEITAVLEHVAYSAALPVGARVCRRGSRLIRTWRGRPGHPVVTALGAAIVAGIVAAAVLWSGGIGPGNRPAPVAIPQGWTLRHVLGATIAAPADYQAYELYDHGGGVVFQLTRGQTDGELLLLRWDIPGGTPEERADYWYRQDLQDPRLADRQVTLSQEEVNGQPSVVLTMTFRGDGGQLWRKRELYYNAGRQPWKIIVDAAVSDAQNTSGDELFEGALSTFRTDSG